MEVSQGLIIGWIAGQLAAAIVCVIIAYRS